MPENSRWFRIRRFLGQHIVVLAPATVLALGIGFSAYASYSWNAYEVADRRFDFETVALRDASIVRINMKKSADAIEYVGNVFEAVGQVDRVAFVRFTTTVQKKNPVIRWTAWVPIVRPAGAAADAVEQFHITEKDRLGALVPASPRDVYYPAVYVAPYEGNESVIGLDFGAKPELRKALEKATSSGAAVAIPNGTPFDARGNDEPGYFLFVPVWSRPSGASDRLLRGFIVSEVGLIRAVREGAPREQSFSPLIAIFDLSAPSSGQLLYPEHLEGIDSDGVADAGGWFVDVDFGATTWRVAALPTTSLDPGLTWQGGLGLFGGIAVSANFAGYLLLLLHRRRHVEELVHLRTEEVERTLRRLTLTEAQLRDYVTTASDWYWDAGPDLRFTTVADRARELGIDPDDLIGLDHLTEGEAGALVEKRMKVLARRQAFKDLRYDYAAADRCMVLSLSGVPKFEDGAFCGYRGSARDITGQLQSEAEQMSARWAAEQANKAKSTFLANMSHEIRTPMNGVLGMMQILRQTGLTDEQRRMCQIISESGSALLQILNDILDFSKLEAGKIELEAIDCCLGEAVDNVVSLMRHAAEAKAVSLVFEGSIDSRWVIADPTRVRQVLLNLISNAIKFSTRGGVLIRLRTEEIVENELHVSLSVTDQGIGMTPAEQGRLFKRFSQGDITSTRRFGGTGLGLAITSELVTLMGGEISVESKIGEGSTFTVSLNLPLAARQGARPASKTLPVRGGHARLNVLVAEDDDINRMVIRMFLEAEGHSVTLVEDGRLAIEAVEAVIYDLILMDIMMPDTDGIAATRRIRQLPMPAASTPIIALTANAMKGDRDTYIAAGMNDHVSKPIDRAQLFTTIERVLGVKAWTPTAVDSAPAPEAQAQDTSRLEDFMSSL